MTIFSIFAMIIVFFASALAVISGFGFVLFSAPLLSHLYEPISTVFLTVGLSTFLLGLVMATTGIRRSMNKNLVLSLVLWSILGLPLGLLILPSIDGTQFRIGIGVITILFVLSRTFGFRFRLRHPIIAIALAGILGGAFSTSTGLSAIPVVLALSNLNLNTYEYRSTVAGYVFLTGLFSLVAFQVAGTLHNLKIDEFLFLIPALLLGMVVGVALVKRLTQKQLRQAILIYLAIIGLIAAIPTGF